MTIKLFYDDATRTTFDASVVSVAREAGGTAVILDQTCFYPEGGGQPADRGTIAGAPVVDVQKRGDDVVHLLSPGGEISTTIVPGATVTGRIDWEYRLDYMQQHTGQHVISASMIHVGGFNTVAVHQGDRYTTIECDTARIPEEQLERIEELANETVCRNLEVRAFNATDSDIPALGLRRAPKVSGTIRIVEIAGFDRVACGGVHTATTGEAGMIKLTGIERIRGNTRTIWKIGQRALVDYREKTNIVNALTERFSAQQHEVVERIEKMEQTAKQAQYDQRAAVQKLGRLWAERLGDPARAGSGVRMITHHFEAESMDLVRAVMESLLASPSVCVVLTNGDTERIHWILGCSPELNLDFNLFKRDLLPIIDGKGGGRPNVWQGVGTRSDQAANFLTLCMTRQAEFVS